MRVFESREKNRERPEMTREFLQELLCDVRREVFDLYDNINAKELKEC